MCGEPVPLLQDVPLSELNVVQVLADDQCVHCVAKLLTCVINFLVELGMCGANFGSRFLCLLSDVIDLVLCVACLLGLFLCKVDEVEVLLDFYRFFPAEHRCTHKAIDHVSPGVDQNLVSVFQLLGFLLPSGEAVVSTSVVEPHHPLGEGFVSFGGKQLAQAFGLDSLVVENVTLLANSVLGAFEVTHDLCLLLEK